MSVCVCVCETLLPRDSFMCNTCTGTQHVGGTVSNEATSGMGRDDLSSSRTCNRSGQAPVLTRLEKPGPWAGKIRARVFAYNIYTSDCCE